MASSDPVDVGSRNRWANAPGRPSGKVEIKLHGETVAFAQHRLAVPAITCQCQTQCLEAKGYGIDIAVNGVSYTTDPTDGDRTQIETLNRVAGKISAQQVRYHKRVYKMLVEMFPGHELPMSEAEFLQLMSHAMVVDALKCSEEAAGGTLCKAVWYALSGMSCLTLVECPDTRYALPSITKEALVVSPKLRELECAIRLSRLAFTWRLVKAHVAERLAVAKAKEAAAAAVGPGPATPARRSKRSGSARRRQSGEAEAEGEAVGGGSSDEDSDSGLAGRGRAKRSKGGPASTGGPGGASPGGACARHKPTVTQRLREENKRLRAEVAELKKEIKAKDKEIARLQSPAPPRRRRH